MNAAETIAAMMAQIEAAVRARFAEVLARNGAMTLVVGASRPDASHPWIQFDFRPTRHFATTVVYVDFRTTALFVYNPRGITANEVRLPYADYQPDHIAATVQHLLTCGPPPAVHHAPTVPHDQ
jgi:hypothetical protein